MSTSLEKEIANKLIWAWKEGCPVAPHDQRLASQMADFIQSRWQSFPRRSKVKNPSKDARIRDLAKGLANTYSKGGMEMIGPLMADYKWLSEQIATILSND